MSLRCLLDNYLFSMFIDFVSFISVSSFHSMARGSGAQSPRYVLHSL